MTAYDLSAGDRDVKKGFVAIGMPSGIGNGGIVTAEQSWRQ
ncbi:hypothetical protein [Thiohalocapsa sp.]|jgi:hypothetical protein|nr:hypothetical protein [Thiohalocapsa sp.]